MRLPWGLSPRPVPAVRSRIAVVLSFLALSLHSCLVVDREIPPASPAALEISYPKAGERVSSTFLPSFSLLVHDQKSFIEDYGETSFICFQLGPSKPVCIDLYASDARVSGAPLGTHMFKAWVADTHYMPLSNVDAVHIEVVSAELAAAEAADATPSTNSLLEWYHQRRAQEFIGATSDTSTGSMSADSGPIKMTGGPSPKAMTGRPGASLNEACRGQRPLLLVVGVKTGANNFAARMALRDTWMGSASAALGSRVCVWFAVGRPEAPAEDAVHAALWLESQLFGDTLIAGTGYDAPDSYYTLVEKTKAFMSFAVERYDFAYLMMMDDDVYLKVDALVGALEASAPRTGFYAGQVWAVQHGRPIRPQRDPAFKNHISKQDWPLDTLLPFAIGPHYVVSRDVAEFVHVNQDRLRGVGTLEDVSVALWALALQVHPQHSDHFSNAKNWGCTDGVVSLADLAPAGIRAAHGNLEGGGSLCDGFDPRVWM